MANRTVFEKLMYGVQPDYKSGCWNWQRAKNKGGYGVVTLSKNVQPYAHRLSWEVFRGEIPDGMYVCHRCDNRKCCNPNHLFLGNQADNMRDMAAKGRGAIGEKSSTAKVTANEVREIRHLALNGLPSKAIGEKFGISFQQVRRIVRYERWAHIK